MGSADQKVAEELFEMGIQVLTSGNHIWDQKEMYSLIAAEPRILSCPPLSTADSWGVMYIHRCPEAVVAVNLIGRGL